MTRTIYHPGGYKPAAPAGNRAEQWDTVAGYTRWNAAGTVVEQRALNAAETALFQGEDKAAAVGKARAELDRAVAVASAPTELANVNNLALAAAGITAGQPWRQPEGAHDAYPLAFQVTFGGKTWESLTPANVWEPGVSGWREVVPPAAGPAAWVQPTGAHDAYAQGAKVTHKGQTWQSTVAANSWEPGVYGWTVVP